ncbi:division/cell wall cluster transcriptional repressor MraZ [Acetatifactor aquisgranensis]|uniref:division/cell wall cluster transcriptional repressor MraZ n=1 Tax=Acetatifactor aquisgranensis TaxID=2941233 RepID=UPI00203B2D47|nr:division/cell wall cluster transcriptional repressor MraZ [Acetatifactor aquisgranensis]
MTEVITVPRKLDGKGRLILPGNFREAADFAPDQEVNVSLAYIEGEKVFIIAKRKEE